MEQILKNKKLRQEGKFIGLPLYKIFPKLSKVLPSFPKGAMWLISASTGVGKLQPLTEPILTPTGWKYMGNIKTNDLVLCPVTGKAIKVLKTYPQENLDIYKITFDDGTYTECCNEHLWKIQERWDVTRNKYKVVDVDWMLKKGILNKKNHSKFRIPLTNPLEFDPKPVILHPYLLGLLLGDGYLPIKSGSSVCLTSHSNISEEVLNTITPLIPYNVKIRLDKEYNGVKARKILFSSTIKPYLKELGLLGLKSSDKKIPNQYLYNSIEVRKEILKGLLDTDGHCEVHPNKKKAGYTTMSEQLKNDVIELIRSLGGKASSFYETRDKYKGGKLWIVNFRTPFNPFSRKIKKNKFASAPYREKFTKAIRNIEFLRKDKGQCIKVDSKDNLYITRDYTVTHNSKFARFLIRSIYSIYKEYKNKGKNPGFKPYFIIFLTEESEEELVIGLTSSLIKAKYNYSLSKLQILSMAETQMSDEEFGYIRGVQPELKELLSFMDINDSIYNPYGIYKYCRYISRQRGIHYYTKLIEPDGFISHAEYEKLDKANQKLYKYAHYTPNDPEDFVIVVVDNLNNLSTERHHNGDLRLAITDWSREYAKKQLSMHWKWSVINVIQQAMDTDKKQFTTKGDSITEKLKPSIAGLGNSKECARDCEIFTGLFKPAKYGINKYEGYNVSKTGLSLNFISAIFEKNRIGTDTFELPLFFDGATERFAPLGSPEEVNAAIEKANKTTK